MNQANTSGWRSAWILGASTGIGAELAKLLGKNVTHVAISARSEDKLKALSQQHKALTPYPLDVTDAQATQKTANKIVAQTGTIDLAILNAGAWYLMDAAELNADSLLKVRQILDVNYMGVMNGLSALIPMMLKQGHGHIAIVASVAGYRGLPKSITYGPTKAALISLCETLKPELEMHNITISVVNPGFVDTPMTADNPFEMPGLMAADEAAKAFLRGLEKRQYEISFPKSFVFQMKLLASLPKGLFFWLMRRFVIEKAMKS